MKKKQSLQLVYHFKYKLWTQDQLIKTQGDIANELIIVGKGWVDLYTKFDGNEFVLETLGLGSIINARNCLMEDN